MRRISSRRICSLPIRRCRQGSPRLVRQSVQPNRRARGMCSIAHDSAAKSAKSMETRPIDGRGHPVEQLPDDTLVFLLGSRYCETDLLLDIAWKMFGQCTPGRDTVLAICDFVHRHIAFDYHHARPTKTALGVRTQRRLPGLRAFGRYAMPRNEYSGAILHRLYQRCRLAACRSADGFRALVPGLRRR